MTMFLWVKLLHIISATVLFGTGLGTAYFMYRAYESGNDEAMAITVRHVVTADWVFTTPAVIVQLLSGLWLTSALNIAFSSTWFIAVIGLYAFVGLCWIPVVCIQVRIRDLLAANAGRDRCRGLMRAWVALGVPAFSAVLLIFFLMVSKYGAYA